MNLKLKRRLYQYLLFFRPVIYLSLIIFFALFFLWLIPKFRPVLSLFSFFNPAITKLESYRGRTNILLLGLAGGEHPGADLTDSLILFSINLTTKDTVLISLPRDIWVESLAAKLNTAFHYGETKSAGGGLILAKSAVSEIINQPVHYAVLIDFSGFEKAIDVVGGIDLTVPHSFVDNQYPVPGKETAEPESERYERLEFLAGPQHFDGPTALKYVRSRHADGEEGSDFARSQRQQLVLMAFKDKLLSLSVLFNPAKIKALKQIFDSSVKTDFPGFVLPDLVKLGLRLKTIDLRTGIIDQGSESEDIPPLLYHPDSSLYGQWVLLPIANNWQAVHRYIEEIIYQNQP